MFSRCPITKEFHFQPPLKKNAIKDISAACVIKCLPLLPKSKSADVHSVIETLIRTYNYKHQMSQHEVIIPAEREKERETYTELFRPDQDLELQTSDVT